MKRILDCQSSDFLNMSRKELLEAIAGSEGRTIACETIGAITPMLGDITNAEFAAAMGADILLLNMFDVNRPHIQGLPKVEPQQVIRKIKELTGRPIGINLEPVEQVLSSEDPAENMWAMTDGRKATLANAEKAADMGVDFILLTGNPGIGVTNEAIEQTLRLYKQRLGDRVILAAGKMHASGILTEGAEKIITQADIAGPRHRSRHHGGVRSAAGRLCAQPELPDHHCHWDIPGRRGRCDHPSDCPDVQDDRYGHSPLGRRRLWRHCAAGKHPGLFDCCQGNPSHLPPHGWLYQPVRKNGAKHPGKGVFCGCPVTV